MHEHALRNIEVVLSLNRYARRDMLRALDTYLSLSKRSYRTLVENITPVPLYDKYVNSGHRQTFFRHVDIRGHVIHLQVG